MSNRAQELTDKALNCIALARAIKDRYPDATQMPAEELANMKALNKEAFRLRELATEEKRHADLEAWGSQPDADHPEPALKAMAGHGAAVAAATGGGPIGQASERVNTERFAKAIRYGVGALNVEEKAIVENATGEILVPHDIAGPIFKTLPRLAVFRSIGPLIRQTTSNKVDVRSLTSATAGWGKVEVLAAEATDVGSTPATTDVIEVHDLMAMAKLGQDELADTDANLVGLIQTIVGQQFAQMEDDAFANGNGTSKPWGLAMRATQASPLITQGTASTGVTGDNLKALQYLVPARHQTNGAYAAARGAAQAIALLKDTTSNYLWQPSARAGEPDTLFGKRFYALEGLPAIGSSAPAVLFGDFNAGYMVADRQQITVQRLDERFAELGLVGFIFKLRVGGDVIRPAAFAKYLVS